VRTNGLTLHPAKTRIADAQQGNGFEFLGYRFEGGRRHVRKKSLDKLKETIRGKTRRTRGHSLNVVIADLNRTLRGWFGYFKHAHPRIFGTLDASGDGCALCCASRNAGRASVALAPTINAGPMPTSRMPGCSRFTPPGKQRDSLDEEPTNRRAVCGKTARTVRRAGSAPADPDPYRNPVGRWNSGFALAARPGMTELRWRTAE